MMEIEAKYRVTDRRVFAELLRMPSLGALRLSPRHALEHQRNTYYDTPDARLAIRHASLRIREVDACRTATLKVSHGSIGAVHVRDEWEAPIEDETDPHTWSDSPLREQVLGLIDSAPLRALFTIHTRRQRVTVLLQGLAIAELSLDEGHVRASGRILGFRELEIELVDGGVIGDLAMITSLLSTRFALTAEPRGKRSRGMALLHALASREQHTAAEQPAFERQVGQPAAI